MKLRVRAFALSTGIVLGIAILVMTWFFLLMDYDGFTLLLLHKIAFFYEITFFGGIIGLIWGFIYGCIWGGIFALVYNTLESKF